MSTRHAIWILLAGELAVLPGCQSTPSASPQSRTDSIVKPVNPTEAKKLWDQPDTDKPTITDAKPSIDALRMRAEEYSRQMEELAAKRAAANAQIAAATTGPRQPAKSTPAPGPVASPNSNPPSTANPSAVDFGAPRGQLPDSAANAPPSAGTPTAPASDPAAVSAPAPTAPAPSVTLTPPRTDVPFNKDTPAVNTTLINGQPPRLPATDELANKLARQINDYPHDVSAHLDWQLLQFLQGQNVPQLSPLSVLQSEDRELLTTLLDGLTNFRTGLRTDNNMLLSRKIKPLLELSDRLRTQAELSVPVVALCTDVKGFGVYEPLDPARFKAGAEHKVIVYCEVENFASLLDEQKRWQTKLTQEVVLYTEQNGLEVWRDKTPIRPIIDYSRNRRHDFFIVKMIRLPANLTIGRYLLKVSVVDQQVSRVAENTAPIQIIAD